MMCVVTYRPSGHSVASSTSTLPPPSSIRRVAHGSGTQAPAMSPFWKAVSVSALACGTIETSPPPEVSELSPSSWSQVRSATSWVLPSCGVATFSPFRSSAEVISGVVTRKAPPDVDPDTMRIASPLDWANALIAGFGPM